LIEVIQSLLPGLPCAQIAIFVLLGIVVLAFFREWAPPDVVALLALGYILFFGLLGPDELIAVFQNKAPITIACMFVLSAGLERTGCIDLLAGFFKKIAGRTETRVMLIMMSFAAVLSAFVNNTPIVVVFLPIVLALAKDAGLQASRLLMPLSFASILGGTCTLTGTSTNLIIDDVATQVAAGDEYAMLDWNPFSMFELSKLGILYALIGFLYMFLIGRRLLPSRDTLGGEIDPEAARTFLTQFSVADDSPLIGQKLTESLLQDIPDMEVLEVQRKGNVLRVPLDKLEIHAGDRLLLTVHGTSFEDLKETEGIRFEAQKKLRLDELETRKVKLMEAIIGPNSRIAGNTLKTLRFRQKYGAMILAVHRQGEDLRKNLGEVKLKFGDTILIEGSPEAINRIRDEQDFITVSEPRSRTLRKRGAWIGGLITMGFVMGASAQGKTFEMAGGSYEPLPIAAYAILAALAFIAFGCIKAREAYRAISWDIVFLIFGMLAVGKAMAATGAAQTIVDGITHLLGENPNPYVVLAVVYLLSSTLTELISNNAVAALLTPIVFSLAVGIDNDPRPFIIAMMFGCSASFATPIGYQTNTYVYGVGGYKFTDFPKIGVPLNLILWVAAVILIPILWPFKAS